MEWKMKKIKCPPFPLDIFRKRTVDVEESDDCVGCSPLIINGRLTSFVLRVPNRKEALYFFKNILGMKVLRHEEFATGCGPACKGFCGTLWSKTMVGYGPEDKFFAFEIVYSYNNENYDVGNGICSITIKGCECLHQAAKNNWSVGEGNVLVSPGGYKFIIVQEPLPRFYDPIQKITLNSSNIKQTVKYWNGVLGLNISSLDHKKKSCGFTFNEKSFILEFQEIDSNIRHGESYGRITCTCPLSQLSKLERNITYSKHTIISPLTTVKSNDKELYRIMVLADPDDHELCFYDELSYRRISKYNPEANTIVNRYINLESGSSTKETPPPETKSAETKTDVTEVAPGDTQTTNPPSPSPEPEKIQSHEIIIVPNAPIHLEQHNQNDDLHKDLKTPSTITPIPILEEDSINETLLLPLSDFDETLKPEDDKIDDKIDDKVSEKKSNNIEEGDNDDKIPEKQQSVLKIEIKSIYQIKKLVFPPTLLIQTGNTPQAVSYWIATDTLELDENDKESIKKKTSKQSIFSDTSAKSLDKTLTQE